MGLFDFVREAGSKVFGGDDDDKSGAEPVRTPDMARADKARGEALEKMIGGMDWGVEGLDVQLSEGRVTIKGQAVSQEVREKVVLLAGNTRGVAQVDDRMSVADPKPEATMYTVKSGDSLSKIAKQHYGDAMKYTVIFEANKPMLKDPNKIYPGQVLRIPPVE